MRGLFCLAMIVLLARPVVAADVADTADAVYLNGRIYTVSSGQPWAQAVAVKGGRFLCVGSDDQVQRYIGKGTRRVDLQGRMVMPGIHDAHAHVMGGGAQAKFTCALPSGPFGERQEALIGRLKECAGRMPGPWLVTGPFLTEQFVDGKPIRKYLDAAFPDRAIFMRETTGHNALANGKALQLAGVRDDERNPHGGEFVRDASGVMTGELIESANALVRNKIPQRSPAENLQAMQLAVRTLNSFGTTSVQEAGTTREVAAAMKALDEAGELTLYVASHLLSQKGSAEQNESLIRDRDRYRSAHYDLNNIKMFLDGTPTAPYFTEVGIDSHTHKPILKNLLIKPEVLNEALRRFDAMGMRVKMHVAGAGASQLAIDAIEYARKANPASKIRHELGHAALILPADMDRMRQLNITADMSPAQWQDIGLYLGNPPQPVWQFRTLAGKGVLMTVGSDWPVISSPNLFPGLQGMLEHGDEAIDLALAIKLLTINGAITSGAERERGSIETGKQATFIVLDRQLFDIPVKQIGGTRVLMTVLEGRPVYDAANQQISGS